MNEANISILMEDYNKWCEQTLEESKNDPNCIHPKQAGKNLINNLIERMSSTYPTLLMKLIYSYEKIKR